MSVGDCGGIQGIPFNVPYGAPQLDSAGKIALAQLPAAIAGALNYQGVWNANTNTPTITSGSGTKGYYYKVSVAGTTTIDTINQWNVGDIIVFNGTTWDKIDGIANEVTSVAGRTGDVTLAVGDISNAVPDSRKVAGHALTGDVTVSFSDLASKPTTVAGYGITDSGRVLYQSWVQVPITGDTNEHSVATVTVPGGALGANGCLRIHLDLSETNNANAKTVKVKLGGSTIFALAQASVASGRRTIIIGNRNSASIQFGSQALTTAAPSTAYSITTAGENTAVDAALDITFQLGTGTDSMNLEGCLVELFYKA